MRRLALLCSSLLVCGQVCAGPAYIETAPLVKYQEEYAYPTTLLKFETSQTVPELEFWDRSGFEVLSPLKATLVLIDQDSVLMTGGFPVKDAKGSIQYSKLTKVFHLSQYKAGGPFKLVDIPEGILFDEGVVTYAVPVTEAEKKDLFDTLMGLIEKAPLKKAKPQPMNSEIAELAGFTQIVHTTRPENLVKILQSGKLIPGKAVKGALYGDPIGNHDAIFMTLLQLDDAYRNVLQGTGNRMPILVFNQVAVLDKLPFHASVGFPFGKFVKYDVSDGSYTRSAHSLDKEAFQSFAFNPSAKLGNEIVVYGELPLIGLSKILVKKGSKEALIKELKEQNIASPNHLDWEDLIAEVQPLIEDKIPEYPKYTNYWLKPYSMNSEDIVRYSFQKHKMSGPEIVDLISREYPGIKKLYNLPAQVHEGYTIKEHTLRVFKEFEEEFPKLSIKKEDLNNITPNMEMLLKVSIALHDIGKSLGPKKEQHEHTPPILQCALERWGYHPDEINIATALIGHDIIGELVQPGKEETPEKALEKLQEKAGLSGLDLDVFFELQKLIFIADAASYPYIKNNVMIKDERGKQRPNSKKYEQLEELIAIKSISNAGTMPKRQQRQFAPLFPLYDLEIQDPLHRYGLGLQDAHDQYEEMIVQNPDWKWAGKFWEWLEAEGGGPLIPKVRYLNAEERRKYEVAFKDGKLQIPFPYKEGEELLFLLSPDGHLYAGRKDRGTAERIGFYHSSFLSGGNVQGSGMMFVDQEGHLMKINDHSGHYRPGDQQMFATLQYLLRQGVDLSKTQIEFETLWEIKLHKQRNNLSPKSPLSALDWYRMKLWKVYRSPALAQTIDDIQGSQKIVNPLKTIDAQKPADHSDLKKGNVLVLVPTDNTFKVSLVQARFESLLKQIRGEDYVDSDLLVKAIPWGHLHETQSYNGAGLMQAMNRGKVAEDWLQTEEAQKLLGEKNIQHIFWTAIENFIQLNVAIDPEDPAVRAPVDYAYILIKNVQDGSTAMSISEGVSLDSRYVEEAMRYGYLPQHRYGAANYQRDKQWNLDAMPGNVTVGKVMTTHVHNLRHDDWHKVLANKSRYEILWESLKNTQVP